ncbi:MAG: alpha/beta fold hydrolase, partial [Candidatus Eremiobacteraeota bacterium]|nr:alpha/beta fold hydrolase [Candidatus Eremiobacteraeota bacterium]
MLILPFVLAAATTALPPRVSAYHSHGHTLVYQTYGSGKSPWILLAGGPGYEPRYVAPLAGMLASSTRRIVVLNQRGTGLSKSAAADSLQLTVDGEVADLEALRGALHLSSLHLIGHSWGGYLAMAYAAQHPERVAAMVLLDPLGDDPRSWLPVTDEMMAALTPAERHDARIACT